MAGLEGSIVNTAHQMALPTIGKEINHYVGNTATMYEKPEGATSLYLHAESGNFRFQLGDTESTLLFASPAAEVDDGTGSMLIPEGALWTVAAPRMVTVVGDASGSVLTYWWL